MRIVITEQFRSFNDTSQKALCLYHDDEMRMKTMIPFLLIETYISTQSLAYVFVVESLFR